MKELEWLLMKKKKRDEVDSKFKKIDKKFYSLKSICKRSCLKQHSKLKSSAYCSQIPM